MDVCVIRKQIDQAKWKVMPDFDHTPKGHKNSKGVWSRLDNNESITILQFKLFNFSGGG